jgi:hypothetical protein
MTWDEPVPLDQGNVAAFRRDGHACLRGVATLLYSQTDGRT